MSEKPLVTDNFADKLPHALLLLALVSGAIYSATLVKSDAAVTAADHANTPEPPSNDRLAPPSGNNTADAMPDSSRLNETLRELFPNETKGFVVTETPITGLHQAQAGTDIVYLTSDANYLIRGELINLENKVNLTEEQRKITRAAILKTIDDSETIDFTTAGAEHTVFVFFDTSCGYCRMLHDNIEGYNKLGINVRYLAFPRAGPGSKTFRQMESIWCSGDKRTTLIGAAANGEEVESVECDNPVASHFDLGRRLGVRATPTLLLYNGDIITGYRPPDQLSARIQASISQTPKTKT